VRAKIHTINGFSAHADQAELLGWHAKTGVKRTFLTHGEPAAMQALAAKLPGEVKMPKLGDSVDL
jgi:metallo-beta-lactamase family protein